MKIAILTLPLHTNYGGILQAYALQVVLEKMGHDIIVFGLKKERPKWIMPIVYAKRFIQNTIFNTDIQIFAEKNARHRFQRLYGKIDSFIENKIKSSNLSHLKAIPTTDLDLIITGSDQVWRKEYINYLWHTTDVSEAFLYSINNVKKIAYAASIGVDKWEFTAEETQKISTALHDFNAISVRELSAVKLLKDHTGCSAIHTLDPTMLLLPEDYFSLLNLPYRNCDEGLVSYILDPDARSDRFVQTVKNVKKLPHRELNIMDEITPRLSVEEWIAGIAGADFVVTDSFHGCVFSIIFNKPFVCIGNSTRGNTRFDSLIETFKISRNFITRIEDLDLNYSYLPPQSTQDILIALRVESFQFLRNAINS